MPGNSLACPQPNSIHSVIVIVYNFKKLVRLTFKGTSTV